MTKYYNMRSKFLKKKNSEKTPPLGKTWEKSLILKRRSL